MPIVGTKRIPIWQKQLQHRYTFIFIISKPYYTTLEKTIDRQIWLYKRNFSNKAHRTKTNSSCNGDYHRTTHNPPTKQVLGQEIQLGRFNPDCPSNRTQQGNESERSQRWISHRKEHNEYHHKSEEYHTHSHTLSSASVCIVLYCIVLYCIVLYCIVLYCIVLHCICIVWFWFDEQRQQCNEWIINRTLTNQDTLLVHVICTSFIYST